MSTSDKNLEARVGMFVMLGFAVVAGLVVHFGGLGKGFRKYYPITVEFSDASGLLKDADVLLAGAKIGKVAAQPKILMEPLVLPVGTGVEVVLSIQEGIKIPRGSQIEVGSSGLLGDRFVQVRPPVKYDPTQVVPAGARLVGFRVTSLQDLAPEGEKLLIEARETVAKINEGVDRIQKEFLGGESVADLKKTLENIRTTSQAFADVSSRVTKFVDSAQGVLDKAGQAVDGVNGAVSTGGKALDTANKAAEDLRAGIADARKLISTAQGTVALGQKGPGVLPMLLNNGQLASDVQSLVSNLKTHGILFYKDSADRPVKPVRPAPAPTPPRLPHR